MMTTVKVYHEGLNKIQIAMIENVEITRENARIYFNEKQWAEVKRAAAEHGYPVESLRYWRKLGHIDVEVQLLALNNEPQFVCEFISSKEPVKRMTLEEAEALTDERSEDLSELRAAGRCVHRAELDNRPMFSKYAGPMWDGIRADGTAVLRYEEWDVYERMCN